MSEKNTKINKKITVYFAVGLLVLNWLFLHAPSATAATLFISPGSVNTSVGRTFTISVNVSSPGDAANAFSGTVNFPANLLEVVSISKSGSIISFWVQEPSFSNVSGNINFEGVAVNPGFSGNTGRIISATFRAKAEGEANLNLSSAAVLANDGKGTNILTGVAGMRVSVGSASSESPSSNTPVAPRISSPSHPDQNSWYQSKNATFSWSLGSGITGVNFLADQDPNSDPGTRSDGVLSSYTYENVNDGIWYFHIKFRNANGWGATSHYKFQIDSNPPTDLTITNNTEPDSDKASFVFDLKDAHSGLGYYEIKIDNGAPVKVYDSSFTTPSLANGQHQLHVVAYDKAGNRIEKAVAFEISAVKVTLVNRLLSGLPAMADQLPKLLYPTILFILIALLWQQRRKRGSNAGIYRELNEIQKQLVAQISMLETAKGKRKLTHEESRLVSELNRTLSVVDDLLIREVKSIQKSRRK